MPPRSRSNASVRFSTSIIFLVTLLQIEQTAWGAILRVGNPLKWADALPHLDYVRTHGVKQFLHHYRRNRHIETPEFKWGDELEYGIFKKTPLRSENPLTGTACFAPPSSSSSSSSTPLSSSASLPLGSNSAEHFDLATGRGVALRERLSALELESEHRSSAGVEWQPEYGSWMIEAVPGSPYGAFVSDLASLESKMQLRRQRLHFGLEADEAAPTLSNFPMLGVDGYPHTERTARPLEQTGELDGSVADSRFLSDHIINPHPRFGTLTRNIRERRGRKVDIAIALPPEHGGGQLQMDAMAFGMGCCCLQLTLQSRSERESRFLHDQLAVLSPLLLALSAATPIFQGRLVDSDCRWNAISAAVDDRTEAESGLTEPDAGGGVNRRPGLYREGVRRLAKSRYSSVSRFLGSVDDESELQRMSALNDIDANMDEDAYLDLVEGGVDCNLAAHIAHLFVRDPLVIFDDQITYPDVDDSKTMAHFENIQSTNWRSVRWKIPGILESAEEDPGADPGADAGAGADADVRRETEAPGIGGRGSSRSGSSRSNRSKPKEVKVSEPHPMGWRVEFRPLEIQPTDFENAAYSIFSVLFSRMSLSLGVSLYMPISLVDENFEAAQGKSAVLNEMFHINRRSLDNIFDPGAANARRHPTDDAKGRHLVVPSVSSLELARLSIDEIFNGEAGAGALNSQKRFRGLLPAVREYLRLVGASSVMMDQLEPYLSLLSRRASGEIPTAALWLRRLVEAHPDYAGDGRLTPSIADHLVTVADQVGMGVRPAPELLGAETASRVARIDASRFDGVPGDVLLTINGLRRPGPRDGESESAQVTTPVGPEPPLSGGGGDGAGPDLDGGFLAPSEEYVPVDCCPTPAPCPF